MTPIPCGPATGDSLKKGLILWVMTLWSCDDPEFGPISDGCLEGS